jgi:hypothetical protein
VEHAKEETTPQQKIRKTHRINLSLRNIALFAELIFHIKRQNNQ